ncbi:MAG: sulfate ABC transporter substrate-binding protein [Methyloceanibacter sp.]
MTRLFAALVAISLLVRPAIAEEPEDILNVSYDVSRELYVDINKAFIPKYKADTGNEIVINQSHAGSSKQARAVLDGLKADVVTFNQFTDVQVLHDQGDLIAADWQARLPNNSVPYYSLPAFLVRKGNPKGIKDWNDLVRDDVQVVFPNPKTSGNGRYTYLAAYAYALEAFKGDLPKTQAFVRKLFANAPVFDTGGRAATTTFVERGIGDVLVTFETEVQGIGKQYGKDKVDLVIPPVSLRADFPVSVVDTVVDERGSRKIAEAYLNYLYTPEAQEIIAAHFNRPIDKDVAAKHANDFAPVRLLTVDDVFGGWDKVNKEHLANGAILDQLYVNK